MNDPTKQPVSAIPPATSPSVPSSSAPSSSAPSPSSPSPAGSRLDQSDAEDCLRIRYRVRFGKTGLLRWISHRDLATLWERLVRRAALKLSMTEGYHPKPRIAFPSALALGVQSLDEVVELELAQELSPSELLRRLSDDNQPGLTICSVRKLPDGFGKAQLDRCDYVIAPPPRVDWNTIQSGIDALLAKEAVSIPRKKKTQTFSVPDNLRSLVRRDLPEVPEPPGLTGTHRAWLELTIGNPEGAVLKPTDVLDLISASDWIENGAAITRVRVHLKKEYDSTDPQHFAASGEVPATN